MRKNSRRTFGFTLVEIMVAVAITATLASIAIPSFARARKRAQASTILAEAETLQNAYEQYAMESRLAPTAVTWVAFKPYIKPGSRLANAMTATACPDILNNNYGAVWAADNSSCRITINSTTQTAMFDALRNPLEFWGNHY